MYEIGFDTEQEFYKFPIFAESPVFFEVIGKLREKSYV